MFKLLNLGKNKKKTDSPSGLVLPSHIAIVMDGNGRWAKKRGLPRTEGHRAGNKTFENITDYCEKIGIKHLTMFALSTENWGRPKNEIDVILSLLEQNLGDAKNKYAHRNIRLRFLGDLSYIQSGSLKKLIREVEDLTKDKTGLNLNICFSYGSRNEITAAAKNMAADIKTGRLSIEQIDEKVFSDYLMTKGQPDVDLLIKPGKELRLSNFLLWQSAYAELWFTDILWPDFKPAHIDEAIAVYNSRERRFGKI